MINKKITPRKYQEKAIDSAYGYIHENKNKNPLIVLPTGTGKSIIPAVLSYKFISAYPWCRVVVLVHSRELVEQNYEKMAQMYPDVESGIYCAGLNRKELHKQVVFASIASISKKTKNLGSINCIIIDEAHMVPLDDTAQYRKFISGLKKYNPKIRVIGLTATPYRLSGGDLRFCKNNIFDEICFEYSVLDAINDGYLTPLTTKGTRVKFDLSSVKKIGNEYVLSEQERIIDAKTQMAVQEIVEKGYNRKSWLVFCSGVDHALSVRDEIRKYRITCEAIYGDMPKDERDSALKKHRTGEITCLTTVDILTTGYDNPRIDLIAMLRKTASPGLYYQMVGRGLRLLFGWIGNLLTPQERTQAIESSEKSNCLVLDFVGNIREHGPIDKIIPPHLPNEKRTKAQAPVKECPECMTIIHLSTRICPDCGYEYPESDKKINGHSYSDAILSSQIESEWHDVVSVKYNIIKIHTRHAINITYQCTNQQYSELVDFDNYDKWIRDNAIKWWSKIMPNKEMPKNSFTFKAIESSLPMIKRINVIPRRDKNGKLKYKILDMET